MIDTMAHMEHHSSISTVTYAEFSQGGLLRFLSHQELMNLFARAASRAGLPLAFSQGFNPRPKLSLPVPSSVGMAGRADLLRIELDEPINPDDLADRLQSQLPDEIVIGRLWSTPQRSHPQPCAVQWQIDLAGLQIGDLEGRVSEFLNCRRYQITRISKKTGKQARIDLRALVLDMQFRPVDGSKVLCVKLAVSPQGSIRPAELLTALDLPVERGLARITRTKIYWRDRAFLD